MSTVVSPIRHDQGRRRARRRPSRQAIRSLLYMAIPMGLLIVFLIAPLVTLGERSFRWELISGNTGFTFDNYTQIFSNSIYVHILVQTAEIAAIAMAIELFISIPLAYVLAFKVRRHQLVLLLVLVLADQLNPMVRIYAWRMLLGREGLINDALMSIGLVSHPVSALLFSRFSVILVLVTSSIVYSSLPIFASMRAVDVRLFEAARDLGASWPQILRRILMPLIAPGILISVILVFVPFFTEFATPSLVGGRSGYMIGSTVAELISSTGEFGGGTAMSLVLLAGSAIFSLIAYSLTRMKTLETAS